MLLPKREIRHYISLLLVSRSITILIIYVFFKDEGVIAIEYMFPVI